MEDGRKEIGKWTENRTVPFVVCVWGVPVRRWARAPCPKALFLSEEDFHMEWLLSFEHEVDGSAQFVGEDREGLGFAVFADEPGMILLGLFISSEEEASGFGEGPLEMDVTDLAVFGAGLFPCGLPGAFDQTAVGDEVLDAGEAVDIVDLIEEDEGEDLSDSGDGS